MSAGRRAVAGALAALILAAVGARLVLGRPVRVGTEAMRPALEAGDVAWVSRAVDPEPGAVVAWEREPGEVALSRVVATPGQEVELHRGRLYLDGAPVPASPAPEGGVTERLGAHEAIVLPGGDAPAVTVPAGHVYLLGDHRLEASDSRQWGPAPVDALQGTALRVLWSTDPATGRIRWERLLRPVR